MRSFPTSWPLLLMSLPLAVIVVLLVIDPGRTLAAVGVAWSWAMGICLGALFIDLVLLACAATWQLPLSRLLEALHGFLPYLGAAGMVTLILGTCRGAFAHAPALHWLWLRTFFYLGWFAACSLTLCALSQRHERDGDPRWMRWRRLTGCAILIPAALGSCIAVMDGYAQLDRFTSSIFGPLMVVSGMLGATAAWTALVALCLRRRLLPIARDHLVAAGRLLLTMVVVAAYLGYSQLLICWMGDLPGEAAWYRPRLHGYVGYVGCGIMLLGYGLPFAALLSHLVKTRPRLIISICTCILMGQYGLDWWTVMPAVAGAQARLDLGDLAAAAFVGGILAWRCSRAWWLAPPRQGPEVMQGLAYSERFE